VKEQELFDWLKTEFFPDLERSPDTYDGFDCTSQEQGMFIELKSRHTHYPDLLIEQAKYDYLMAESEKLAFAAYYINSTPEGVWSFKLDSVPQMEWAEKWLPTTTEFANKNNKMKSVGFLKLEWGTQIK